MLPPSLSPHRLFTVNADATRRDGDYVLYWMVAARRSRFNFALERAVAWAHELDRPLLVVEPLRVDYQWASDRVHTAVLQGMADNHAAFGAAGVTYHPWVEPHVGASAGMFAAFAERACVVVTDASPVHFLPRWWLAVQRCPGTHLEAVDGHGLYPLAATPGPFSTAYAFRRFLQKNLSPELVCWPEADPLRHAPHRVPPDSLTPLDRWPRASPGILAARLDALGALPIDHAIAPVVRRSGPVAATGRLERFIEKNLPHYADRRGDIDEDVSSGLSADLHFGHISPHEIVAAVAGASGGSPGGPKGKTDGKKTGWWGLPSSSELFLDQVITWRELGAVQAHHRPDTHNRYEAVPDWARATLAAHADDVRPVTYDLATLERAATHDPLWNAAQRQLVREGHIHNYLRMLWGKKVLEWSPDPAEAFARLTELNNRYALDGRDPNSASGISWCFGHFDRPWGPMRPIFGTVRYMSSANTQRKMDTKAYLQRYSA